jgi:hypothetical protein
LKKEFLRDYRNFFRDEFLSEQVGKHNHVILETQIQRVKEFFRRHSNLTVKEINANWPICFELVLPSRLEEMDLENEHVSFDFINLMRDVFGAKPNTDSVNRFFGNKVI